LDFRNHLLSHIERLQLILELLELVAGRLELGILVLHELFLVGNLLVDPLHQQLLGLVLLLFVLLDGVQVLGNVLGWGHLHVVLGAGVLEEGQLAL